MKKTHILLVMSIFILTSCGSIKKVEKADFEKYRIEPGTKYPNDFELASFKLRVSCKQQKVYLQGSVSKKDSYKDVEGAFVAISNENGRRVLDTTNRIGFYGLSTTVGKADTLYFYKKRYNVYSIDLSMFMQEQYKRK